MQTNKVTLSIFIEVLDIEAAKAMANLALEQLYVSDIETGKLVSVDGDQVSWNVIREEVLF